MPLQNEQEFHDPVLKEAVCRCWACDCAPQDLRQKITDLLQEKPRTSARPEPRMKMSAWLIWPAALAASVLVVLGVLHAFHPPTGQLASNGSAGNNGIQSHPAPGIASPADSQPSLPVSLETALVSRHDLCCAEANHQHLPVPIGDDAGIVAAMRATLNQPVVVFHPDGPGWTFHGASICPVGTTPSGHLVFSRGADTLSIFSLPRSLLPTAVEGSDYAGDYEQHHIVGFIKDGALFCLVGEGLGDDVSASALQRMKSRMQPTIASIASPRSSAVVLAELLHPIEP